MQYNLPGGRTRLQPMSLPNVMRYAKVASRLGEALLPLFPKRAAALRAGQLSQHPTFFEDLLVAGLVRSHTRQRTLDQLTPLHDWFWSNTPAVQFHEFAERRFEHWFLANHVAIVPAIRAALEADPVTYSTLCEVGCGSGKVLQHMTQAFPEIRRFIGLDLSPEQVARNRVRFPAQRMEFEAADGPTWIDRNAQPGWIYLTCAGVFEYVSRDNLLALLTTLATRLKPSLFGMVESLSDDYDLENDSESVPYGAEMVFSHNYIEILNLAGFDILHRSEQRVDNQRWLLLVARSR